VTDRTKLTAKSTVEINGVGDTLAAHRIAGLVKQNDAGMWVMAGECPVPALTPPRH
jgi:hypothetical protein